MIIRVAQFGKRLQGKSAGRMHYGQLCKQMATAKPAQIVFLSFKGVESVNASWMNMAIAPLFRWAAESQNDFYPVLCHFPGKDTDELELVARVNNQCFLVADNETLPINTASIVGTIDPSLESTLKQLAGRRDATGAELARRLPDEQVLATAWNNRLKELYDKRLLLRRKEGRRQVYSSVAKEVTLNG